jgi:hypothetical protein
MLSYETFDVLLTHESPRDAMIVNAGSDAITAVVRLAGPAFAFFGHYHGEGQLDACDFAPTQVFHPHGLEFRQRGGCAESGSVGVLRWDERGGQFEYVDAAWLRTCTRHNWGHR